MLDIKFVRENPALVEEAVKNRGGELCLDGFLAIEKKRRELLTEVESLKNKRNLASKEISVLKKNKQNADDLVAQMRAIGDKIAELDAKVKEADEEMKNIILGIPNIPHASTPIGASEDDNPEVRRWGTPREFTFQPKAHWEIGEDLNILDFERGAKVTGARFTFYRGLGARRQYQSV